MGRSIWLPVLVGGALRLAAVLVVPTVPIGDGAAYDLFAAHLAAGQGYTSGGVPSAQYAPGYPLLLAALYWLGGWDHVWAKLAHVVAGAATIWLTCRCGAALGEAGAGLLGAWILALFPSQALWAPVLAAENLYTPLCMGLLLVVMAGQRWRAAAGGGLLLGCATLTRPQAALIPVLGLGVLVLLRRWRWRRALAFTAATCLVAAAVMAPWAWRNARVFGSFVLVSTTLGGALFDGEPEARPAVYAAFRAAGLPTEEGPGWYGRDATLQAPTPPALALARDRLAAAAVERWDAEHPTAFVVHTLRRLGRIFVANLDVTPVYFAFFWHDPAWQETAFYGPLLDAAWARRPLDPAGIATLAGVVMAYYAAVLVAAVVGAARTVAAVAAARCSRLALTPLAFVGYHSLTSAMILGVDRYHTPCIPLLALYAALAWRRRQAV